MEEYHYLRLVMDGKTGNDSSDTVVKHKMFDLKWRLQSLGEDSEVQSRTSSIVAVDRNYSECAGNARNFAMLIREAGQLKLYFHCLMAT